MRARPKKEVWKGTGPTPTRAPRPTRPERNGDNGTHRTAPEHTPRQTLDRETETRSKTQDKHTPSHCWASCGTVHYSTADCTVSPRRGGRACLRRARERASHSVDRRMPPNNTLPESCSCKQVASIPSAGVACVKEIRQWKRRRKDDGWRAPKKYQPRTPHDYLYRIIPPMIRNVTTADWSDAFQHLPQTSARAALIYIQIGSWPPWMPFVLASAAANAAHVAFYFLGNNPLDITICGHACAWLPVDMASINDRVHRHLDTNDSPITTGYKLADLKPLWAAIFP